MFRVDYLISSCSCFNPWTSVSVCSQNTTVTTCKNPFPFIFSHSQITCKLFTGLIGKQRSQILEIRILYSIFDKTDKIKEHLMLVYFIEFVSLFACRTEKNQPELVILHSRLQLESQKQKAWSEPLA